MYAKNNVVRLRQRPKMAGMGWVAEAASLYSAYNQQKEGGSGGVGAGAAPGAGVGAAQPVSATAVSPTIQQSFTPQISPVFQQSSGGGSQTASTQQIAPGGQTGQGGSATAQPAPQATPGYGYTAPSYTPSYGVGSNLPSLADPMTGTDYTKIATQPYTAMQPGLPWTAIILGGVALVGIVAWSRTKTRK